MDTDQVQTYVEYLQGLDRSAATIRAYQNDLNQFADWFAQNARSGSQMTAAQVTPLDLRDYKVALNGQKPSTINRKIAALRAFFAWAVEQGLTTANPISGIRNVKEVDDLAPRWLDRLEQRALVRVLDQAVQQKHGEARMLACRDRAIILVMMHAGLRIAEVIDLKIADVTLSERSGTVTVRHGKGNKRRVVPLNKSARQAIQVWLTGRAETNPAAGLFVAPRTGNKLTPNGLYKRIVEWGDQAGIVLSPHALRHTCAHELIEHGCSIDRVAAILGHDNLNTTRRYTQPSQGDLQTEADKISWEE